MKTQTAPKLTLAAKIESILNDKAEGRLFAESMLAAVKKGHPIVIDGVEVFPKVTSYFMRDLDGEFQDYCPTCFVAEVHKGMLDVDDAVAYADECVSDERCVECCSTL